MKSVIKGAFCGLVLAASLGTIASAHDYKLGDLTLMHPWARASAGMAKAGAVYVEITNNGSTEDRLIAIKTDVSKKAETHTMTHVDGVMRMREIENVSIPAGATVSLAPGGDHIMLMGLKAPLKEGEMIPLTLVFENAGEVEVKAAVTSIAAKTAPMGDMPAGHMMEEGKGKMKGSMDHSQ